MIVSRIMAMARPRRPARERELVIAAAERLSTSKRSASAKARKIACLVATSVDQEFDGTQDDVIRLAYQFLAKTESDPIIELATCPEIDTAAIIRAARLKRFENRGFRHLPECEWASERRTIYGELCDQLARRYENYLSRSSESCP